MFGQSTVSTQGLLTLKKGLCRVKPMGPSSGGAGCRAHEAEVVPETELWSVDSQHSGFQIGQSCLQQERLPSTYHRRKLAKSALARAADNDRTPMDRDSRVRGSVGQ